MEFFFFPLGCLTVIGFLGYLVWETLRMKSVSGLIFLSVFALSLTLFAYIETTFTAFWWLINVIQTIFVAFLTAHTIGTLTSFRARERDFKPLLPEASYPEVTVLICVYNEQAAIAATIEACLALDYPADRFHIVVHDDNSSDGTWEAMQPYATKVRLLRRGNFPTKGKAVAMNRIIPTLETELVCVFDCDSLPSPDFLKRCTRHFKDPQIALVQGRNIEYNRVTFMARLVAMDQDNIHFSVYFPKRRLRGMVMFEGRAGVFRKSVFIQLGGFDTELPTEDWDFGVRVQIPGLRNLYDHTALSYEQAPEDFGGYIRQRTRWLASTIFSMLKSLRPVLSSPHLYISQKIDYFFATTYQLWSLSVNMFGFLAFYNLLIGHTLNAIYPGIMFILVVVILEIPSIFLQKKWRYLLYLPVMYLYYWTFTYVVTKVVLDHFVLRKRIIYKKAEHSGPSIPAVLENQLEKN